ncbi:MAG: hypothetical protein O9306_14510 [Beijerinckiaceae bacterium]|jgi:hypothetical protein|nr:hypothetical protein [Beijerinckiaceae bacterium]
MSSDLDEFRNQLPAYLSAADQEKLFGELKRIVSGEDISYYLSDYQNEFINDMLQGDGWRGFRFFDFATDSWRTIRGIIISNSCDIDPSNPRDTPSRVSFVPIVRLSNYINILREAGVSTTKIDAKVASIRSQKTTNVFFLPKHSPLDDEYIARLDEICSMPVLLYKKSTDKKIFTLSNTGFYMFVLKLSIHFCRLQEKINRSSTSGPAAA